jgi:hypothetical protein
MPIIDVIRLISDIAGSELLRNNLNRCGSTAELISMLNQRGYYFSHDEFNEAARVLHLGCQSEEEAAFLMEKVMWLRYVLNFQSE